MEISLGRKRSITWLELILRSFERLQRQIDESGIDRAAAAGEGSNVFHGRVGLDDVNEAQSKRLHGLEGNVLRALNAAENVPLSCCGKNPLGTIRTDRHSRRW